MQAISANLFESRYDGSMRTGRPCNHRDNPFGAKLHAAREALGLSQAEVAAKLGINQASYGAWERQPVALRPEQIAKLAEALNVTVEYLFGKDEKKRRGGPTGKARKLFEQVNELPRSQQQHVLTVVEAFVKQKAGVSS